MTRNRYYLSQQSGESPTREPTVARPRMFERRPVMTRSIRFSALRLTLVLLLPLFVCSCVILSLHPFAGSGDKIFKEELLGKWENEAEAIAMTFDATLQADKKKGYWVLYSNKGKSANLEAALTEIKGTCFMDYVARPKFQTKFERFSYGIHMIAGHALWRLTMSGNHLEISGLSYDWFEDRIKKKELSGLRYEILQDDRIVLTSPTKELRSFIAKHKDEKGLFREPLVLVKSGVTKPSKTR